MRQGARTRQTGTRPSVRFPSVSAWPYTPKIPPMAPTSLEPLRAPPKPHHSTGRLPPVLLRGVLERVPDQMDDTCQHHSLGEHHPDRVRKSLQPVADDEEDVFNAAVLQLRKDLEPELRRLAVSGAGPQPQDVLVAGQVDPD